jgi:hypothetical protein
MSIDTYKKLAGKFKLYKLLDEFIHRNTFIYCNWVYSYQAVSLHTTQNLNPNLCTSEGFYEAVCCNWVGQVWE